MTQTEKDRLDTIEFHKNFPENNIMLRAVGTKTTILENKKGFKMREIYYSELRDSLKKVDSKVLELVLENVFDVVTIFNLKFDLLKVIDNELENVYANDDLKYSNNINNKIMNILEKV